MNAITDFMSKRNNLTVIHNHIYDFIHNNKHSAAIISNIYYYYYYDEVIISVSYHHNTDKSVIYRFDNIGVTFNHLRVSYSDPVLYDKILDSLHKFNRKIEDHKNYLAADYINE